MPHDQGLVHGNPEVAELWGPLIAALGDREVDDCVTVSPPGFGTASSATPHS